MRSRSTRWVASRVSSALLTIWCVPPAPSGSPATCSGARTAVEAGLRYADPRSACRSSAVPRGHARPAGRARRRPRRCPRHEIEPHDGASDLCASRAEQPPETEDLALVQGQIDAMDDTRTAQLPHMQERLVRDTFGLLLPIEANVTDHQPDDVVRRQLAHRAGTDGLAAAKHGRPISRSWKTSSRKCVM